MLKRIVGFILFAFISVQAVAEETPQLKLYSVPYNSPKDQCQKDVASAFEKIGYKNQDIEDGSITASRDGYRAVVSCIAANRSCDAGDDIDRIIIVVAGPDASVAKTKAAELVDQFYVL